MVKLANILSQLNKAKILVIGDMLLDTYTIGRARRISPEAPVAVVHVEREEHRPGGAGNVILNLLSLGADVVAVGRVGNDWGGDILKSVLEREGIATHALFTQTQYRTPIKNRILSDNQQIVRIDHEQFIPLTNELETIIIHSLPKLLTDVKAIAISDYGKGLLTETLLKKLIELAKEMNISVITDPKGQYFAQYGGTTIIKPNLTEAYLAANMPRHFPLHQVAEKLFKLTQAQWLMITLSEEGIALFKSDGQCYNFPVVVKEVKDVTGAGDTVLAILTYSIANGLSYLDAAELCNIAASIAIEHVGCARITLSDLAHRLLEQHMHCKVFDQDHLFVLLEVLKSRPYHLLIVTNFETVSRLLLETIKHLSSSNVDLVVYIDEDKPLDLLVDLLSSLNEVSFVIIERDSLQKLQLAKKPEKTQLLHSTWTSVKSIDLDGYLKQAFFPEAAPCN